MRYVLYHSPCYDGYGAAYAVWLKHKDAGTTYHPCVYGGPIPEIPDGSDVYFVDFSTDLETTEALASRCNVTIIDHHKTAFERLGHLPYAHFDMDHSGAWLTYRYFHGEEPPLLFRYLEDRDLWRFQLPGSREIDCFVKAHKFDFAAWKWLEAALEDDFDRCLYAGEWIRTYQGKMVSMMCDQVIYQVIGGHRVPTCNATMAWSEVGEEMLARHSNAPFCASFFDRAAGNGGVLRTYSLRSRGFDVSAIAAQYNGGGHPQAAGFCVQIGPPPLS